ncbi:MAG TPA: M20/M25/M40 family metallo-hydrolase [Rhodopila sp.]|uniref:M20 family metallopeptidase n=1 Tax=Rhodopila sp. TaxID=2480087 RepID=UPI002C1D9A37|nr:M20/M25/M40 family metallo-hydrolase [Rhodopila sp.]HVY16579.1 M20/M25/M40 family metallo-hydrolase [Rhodopila sp.]
MDTIASTIADLTRDLVKLDSRSSVSNIPVADRIEPELRGFDVERVDYADAAGVAKRVLVANRGGPGGIAFSGHMDTVPETGWQADPWSGRVDDGGVLHGLGSTDMKGPVAAAIVAARSLPDRVPVTLLITTDEETTKRGARAIAEKSELVKRIRPKGILVVEPTSLRPVRGHRSHIQFTCTAEGVQAHSSTGKGRNANWTLIPFLAEMKTIYDRLRTDRTLQDDAYDPPFSDFNVIIDNHGTAVNVTVPLATAVIKFRYSASIDPTYVREAVHAAGRTHGVAVREAEEGSPPELPADHPFVAACTEVAGQAPVTAPFGTDASILQSIAPCVIMGPGDIGVAHKPDEAVSIGELASAVPLFQALAGRFA